MAERCSAVTKSGGRCHATVVSEGMCAWHAPSWAERRRQWSVRGGHGKSNAARAKKKLPAGLITTDELRGLVGLTINGVLTGQIEPGVGNAVASLSRAYIVIAEAGAAETLQAQVDELRDLIARRGLAQ